MTITRKILTLVALIVTASSLAQTGEAAAALKSRTYHFGTHPARTNITFVSEADLETIHGVTHSVSGKVKVAADGTTASGTLTVPVHSLRTGIAKRDEHLRSDAWLDAARFSQIRLQLLGAKEGKDGKTWSYTARVTIKGVTKDIKTSARVRAIPDRLGKALGGGSWVRVRSSFQVTLSDFGIKIPQRIGAKVSKTWDVGVDIYGTTAAPRRAAR